MEGALAVDLSSLKGKRMLNIDSEKEGELTVSCAGGVRVNGFLPVQWEEIPQEFQGAKITLTGLMGGHSGVEIHKNRGNANILMGKVLKELSEKIHIVLAALEGGTKDNAIPREAGAAVFFPKGELESFERILKEIEKSKRKSMNRLTEGFVSFFGR